MAQAVAAGFGESSYNLNAALRLTTRKRRKEGSHSENTESQNLISCWSIRPIAIFYLTTPNPAIAGFSPSLTKEGSRYCSFKVISVKYPAIYFPV